MFSISYTLPFARTPSFLAQYIALPLSVLCDSPPVSYGFYLLARAGTSGFEIDMRLQDRWSSPSDLLAFPHAMRQQLPLANRAVNPCDGKDGRVVLKFASPIFGAYEGPNSPDMELEDRSPKVPSQSGPTNLVIASAAPQPNARQASPPFGPRASGDWSVSYRERTGKPNAMARIIEGWRDVRLLDRCREPLRLGHRDQEYIRWNKIPLRRVFCDTQYQRLRSPSTIAMSIWVFELMN